MVPIRVELYTRRGCHLCDVVKTELLGVRTERPFELVEVDVDSTAALKQTYGLLVPVVVVDGQRISELRFGEPARAALRRCLEGTP